MLNRIPRSTLNNTKGEAEHLAVRQKMDGKGENLRLPKKKNS